MRRRLAGLLLVVAAAALAGGGGSTPEAQQPTGPTGFTPDGMHVGAVALPDAGDGRPFAMKAEKGGLLLVFFGYTRCPDICPMTLSALHRIKQDLPADDRARVDVAFVTVDPDRDSAPTLERYLASFLDRFHGLRTTDPAVLGAAEMAFAASSQVTTDAATGDVQVSHTASLYAVDENGAVVRVWPFGMDPSVILAEVRGLLR